MANCKIRFCKQLGGQLTVMPDWVANTEVSVTESDILAICI